VRSPTSRLAGKLTTLTAALGALVTLTATAAHAVTVDGIDTSHYQHAPTLDWTKAKGDGVQFAFIKATEGTTFRDPYFTSDWAATQANGLYRGAYHFARPVVGTAEKQARYFASVIGPQTGRGTLPPVLDLEATGGLDKTQLVAWTRAFLTKLEELTGRTPIIYVSPAFWEYYLGNTTAFTRYPLWIANYGVSAPRVPGGWPTWTFWQTSSSGRIKGISGRVDTDLFNGSMTGLRKLALAYEPQPVNLALTTSNPAPTTGQTVTFSGTLTDATGAAVAGRSVTLSSQAPGTSTWTTLGTAVTTTSGAFSLPEPVTAAAGYRATFAGDSDFAPATSPTVAVALTALPTRIRLTTSATSALAGQQITFSGVLRPVRAMANRSLIVTMMPTGSATWHTVGTTTTDAMGRYAASFPVLESGTYVVSFAGEPAYAAAAARTTLDVSLNPSSITLAASNLAPYRNRYVALTGQLRTGPAPLTGRTVVLSRLLPGETTWRRVATVTTDSLGRFRAKAFVDRAATYRAVFAQDQLNQSAASAPKILTITPPVASSLELRTGRTHVRAGRVTVLEGALTDRAGHAAVGRTVQLWRKGVGTHRWFKVGHTVTSETGAWRIKDVPIRDCVYRAKFLGGTHFKASHSATIRVTMV